MSVVMVERGVSISGIHSYALYQAKIDGPCYSLEPQSPDHDG